MDDEVVVFEDEGSDGKGEEAPRAEKPETKTAPITQTMSSMWSFVATKAPDLTQVKENAAAARQKAKQQWDNVAPMRQNAWNQVSTGVKTGWSTIETVRQKSGESVARALQKKQADDDSADKKTAITESTATESNNIMQRFASSTIDSLAWAGQKIGEQANATSFAAATTAAPILKQVQSKITKSANSSEDQSSPEEAQAEGTSDSGEPNVASITKTANASTDEWSEAVSSPRVTAAAAQAKAQEANEATVPKKKIADIQGCTATKKVVEIQTSTEQIPQKKMAEL